MRWKASWRLNNVQYRKHGSTGTVTVEGVSEQQARERAREEGSRQVVGSLLMFDYIEVTQLTKLPH